ncbi:hypothetical protein PIB30_033360 [Stylosanthes scabra]|uniref:Glycosyltransferase N-terminal domain-containing protein n=1 Tax=Stylosanthes scabra TaxID=79078 RepID=A0ABU6XAK9_9FABA|nr:hypothetical protein [Stylosanthes scabra]
MGSLNATKKKPHAVFMPFPAQGHINSILKLAKLLHQKGFHITFVNTEYNHNRLLKFRGSDSLRGLPSFRFETIPDGLPVDPNHVDATQDIPSLCDSTSKNMLPHFKKLLWKLNNNKDPGVDAGEELGVPVVVFWTASACGTMDYMHYRQLVDKGFTS